MSNDAIPGECAMTASTRLPFRDDDHGICALGLGHSLSIASLVIGHFP